MRLRFGLLCAVLLISSSLFAQDFRGGVSGTVKDGSGSVLPGVTITATNVETNVAATAITDAKGFYQIRYLNSGHYKIEARLEGFKPVIRQGVTVRIGDVIPADFRLEMGAMAEIISVTASAPILDTSSGVTGQVIDSNQIQRLPLGDGTAYMLTRLAPGVADSSDLHFSRPMDNGNLAGITVNGALGGNEFTLDGAPNRVSPNNTNPGNNSGVVGFSPPSDAISEYKVQTNAFDAQSGHTAGATVNLALRSGTNNIKGTAAYYNRSDARSSTPLLTKHNGGAKPTRQYDRMLGSLAGPIVHDRTFFMLSFEHLRDVQPEPVSYSVPTLKMRRGDMSDFTSIIYDPLTATGSNLTRTRFAGNIIPPERINAVARAYLSLYPEPNRPGVGVGGLSQNYFTNQLRPYDYNGFVTRLDHSLNDSNKLFLSGYWNKRREDRYNWALGATNATGKGEIGDFLVTNGFDFRSNTGATVGYTSVLGTSLVLDVRGAWSRFGEWRKSGDNFDPAAMGFSPTAQALMKDYHYLPFINFGGFSTTNANSTIATLGSMRSDWNTGFNRPFTNMSFVPTADWLWGQHSMRSGYELRNQRWDITVPAYGAGRYFFNGFFTRLNNSAALNDPAQEWAQFLLGLPTVASGNPGTSSGNFSQFEIVAEGDWRQISHALYVQDDWHFNQNLTLNLGVRMELQQAMSESENRALGGFDRTISSPVEAAAVAAYARNPIAEIPVGQFQVKGGVRFADGGIYNNLSKVMPRGAFSYLIGDKTVIRGGAGLFSYDYYFDAGNQTGFSQPTPILTTPDNGATFTTDLTNPIPSGQLIQPRGSSLGAAANLGLTLGTIVPSHREVPYYARWQLGAQRDLGAGWKVEGYYLESRGRHLPVARELNGIPLQYLSASRERDTAVETFLSQSVPNPFAGLLPGTPLNNATVTRAQLLRPFPQFGASANNGAVSGTGTISVGTEEYRGSDHYQAGSIILEKRFTGHNSLIATYTRSHETDQLNFLNPANDILENRISPNDRPNRFTLGGVLDLPFGHGQKFGNGWNALTDAILGGWSVSAAYQYQSGFPLTWNTNVYYDPSRDPKDLHSNIGGSCPGGGKAGLDCPAWDTSGFYIPGDTGNARLTNQRIQVQNNVRYFPSTLPNVRTAYLNLLDFGIYKTFAIARGTALQVRIEAINALNYTVLVSPDQNPRNATFGMNVTDRNNPRDVQLGARLTF